MAPGPQPPLRLSRRLSHSRPRFTSFCWNRAVLSARPSEASTIWTPAGAHHSLVCWLMNTLFGFLTTRTVMGLRFGVGVGVGVGVGCGVGVATGSLGCTAVRVGLGDGSAL